MPKSLLDYAYDCVKASKGQVSFKDLWAYVVKEAGFDEETAKEDACRMEHDISDKSWAAIKKHAEFLKK